MSSQQTDGPVMHIIFNILALVYERTDKWSHQGISVLVREGHMNESGSSKVFYDQCVPTNHKEKAYRNRDRTPDIVQLIC